MPFFIALFCLFGGFFCFYLAQQQKLRKPKQIGFLDLSHPRHIQFLLLEEKSTNFEEWASHVNLAKQERKSWARVLLHKSAVGWSIEDKNHKPIVLKNRRWIRRSHLVHGDLIDIYNLCLLFYVPKEAETPLTRHRKPLPTGEEPAQDVAAQESEPMFSFPYLQSSDLKKKPLLLDKNLCFIGRSYNNDLVIRSPMVASRQAKITMVSDRATLFNLAPDFNTFVNGKRVEEKQLIHRDEISFDGQKYRFIQKDR